jgi:HEAT repeat protein
VDELLDLLEDDDQAVRFAAALVLGRVNGPVVTRALVERVTENPSGATEAWIALVACRGELADEFLAFASREPRFLGHVNGARVRWARIIN